MENFQRVVKNYVAMSWTIAVCRIVSMLIYRVKHIHTVINYAYDRITHVIVISIWKLICRAFWQKNILWKIVSRPELVGGYRFSLMIGFWNFLAFIVIRIVSLMGSIRWFSRKFLVFLPWKSGRSARKFHARCDGDMLVRVRQEVHESSSCFRTNPIDKIILSDFQA